jgi:hypothetical protein
MAPSLALIPVGFLTPIDIRCRKPGSLRQFRNDESRYLVFFVLGQAAVPDGQ